MKEHIVDQLSISAHEIENATIIRSGIIPISTGKLTLEHEGVFLDVSVYCVKYCKFSRLLIEDIIDAGFLDMDELYDYLKSTSNDSPVLDKMVTLIKFNLIKNN
jgi:hypothetical protein